jgi:hypothetical protein
MRNDAYFNKFLGAKRASAILPTQKKAIEKALELNPDLKPHVARVRHTKAGHPDQFEKK